MKHLYSLSHRWGTMTISYMAALAKPLGYLILFLLFFQDLAQAQIPRSMSQNKTHATGSLLSGNASRVDSDAPEAYDKQGAQTVMDHGGNRLSLLLAPSLVAKDLNAPTLVSALPVVQTSTQITLTYSEPVQTNGTNPTDFTVTDGGGTTYAVTAQEDGTAGDNDIILTLADFRESVGGLTITYTNNNDEIRDLDGNAAATDATGVSVGVPLVGACPAPYDNFLDFDLVDFGPPAELLPLVPATVNQTVTATSVWGNDAIPIRVEAGQKYRVSLVNSEAILQGLLDDGTFDNFQVDPKVGFDPMITMVDIDATGVSVAAASSLSNPGNTTILAFNQDSSPTNRFPELEFTATTTDTIYALIDAEPNSFIFSSPDPTNFLRLADNCNEFVTDSVAVEVTLLPAGPALQSATKDSDTQITATFDGNVQTNGTNPADFTVVDGLGTNFAVSAQADGTPGDANIVLTVADLSTAIGDLTVAYTNNNDEIADASDATSTATTGSITIDLDTGPPSLSSATKDSETQITVTMSEPVQTNGTNPTDFTVTDGAGSSYTVSTQADGTANDTQVVLTVADLSGALGDLIVTYTNNNNEISDFGGNNLATDATGVTIDLDSTVPSVAIARQDPTGERANKDPITFRVTFSEQVDNVDITDFEISGAGAGGSASISELTTETANTVFDIKVSTIDTEGELDLDFAAGQNISDFGGNAFAGSITSEETYTIDKTRPTITSITRNSPTSEITNASSVVFRITLSEEVTNAGTGDFELSGAGGGGTAAVTAVSTQALSTVIDVTVSTIDTDGELGLDIFVFHSLTDEAGNSFAGTITTEETYTIDMTAPTLSSAAKDSETQITVSMDEVVLTNGTNPTDFIITDGLGNTYAVSAQADGTADDTDIVLTVADLSAAVGDVTVTYTNNNDEITDLGGNSLDTDATGVTINTDTTDPTLVSGQIDSDTQLTITLSEPIQVIGDTPEDWTVKDATNTPFAVSNVSDGTAQDEKLVLTVADFSAATGPLTVTYTEDCAIIADFGNNTLATDATGIEVALNPILESATLDSDTQITVTFDQNVQTNEGNPTDFSVTDGLGSTFAVSAQADGTAGDTDIELAVADLSAAIGDLTVTYTNNNNEISDAATGTLFAETRSTAIDTDQTAPTLVSATRDSDTQITLTLSEPVQTNGTNPTDFTVTDGSGTNFPVSAQADGTAQDNQLVLTVASMAAAQGSINITYTNNNDEITDFGGNSLDTDDIGVVIAQAGAFVFQYDTDLGTNNITIDTDVAFTYNFNVFWGDGNADLNQTASVGHTYAADGIYTVTITGDLPFFDINSNSAIVSLSQWGNQVWMAVDSMFFEAENMEYKATDAPNLSQVTSTRDMFYENRAMGSPDLSNWDVSTITDMRGMFAGAQSFNGDVTNWNVSNVTNFSHMFQSAMAFDQDITGWNVANATTTAYMFAQNRVFPNEPDGNIGDLEFGWANPEEGLLPMSFNQAVGVWNVSNVTDMGYMFEDNAAFNQPLNAWDVSKVTNMEEMFEGADAFDQDLDQWDVSNVVNMREMFKDTDIFNGDISTWNTSNVQTTREMFEDARLFNQDISGWVLSKDTTMLEMFQNAKAFNQDISGWDVSKVQIMEETFEGADAFNQDISGWNVTAVTTMEEMFKNTDVFNQPLAAWTVSSVTNMSGMFEGTEVFNQPLAGWDVSAVTDMSDMFLESVAFNQDISGWNIAALTDAKDLLVDAEAFRQVNWDKALIAWAALDNVPQDLEIDASVGYCSSETARQNLIDTHNWDIDDEGLDCPPVMTSAVANNATTITVTFDQNLKTNEGNPTDFTVTDAEGNTFAVTAQADGTADDTDLVLTVADLTLSVGVLTITYTNNNNEIFDAAFNFTETDATGVAVSDTFVPTLESATKDSDTQITVTLHEPVKLVGTLSPTDFTVVDNDGTGFAVSAVTDGTAEDQEIVLTVADLSAALINLTVTYANNNALVQDLADNELATDATGVVIPLASVVTEVSVPSSQSYGIGDELEFTVTFDPAVSITGSPQLPLTIGNATVNAGFSTEGGTDNVTQATFSYTVLAGQLDTDGIAVGAALTLNGGTVKNAQNLDAILSLNNVASTEAVLVDGVAPDAPVVTSLSEDAGKFSDDQVTNDVTLSFSGTAEANSTVTVFINGSNRGITTADASGGWSFDSSVGEAAFTFDEGDHVVTATATDAVGNESDESDDFDLTVDLTAPGQPTLDLDASTDLGISDSDNLTSGNLLTFNGTAEPNSTLFLALAGDDGNIAPESGPGEPIDVDAEGNWTFTIDGEIPLEEFPLIAIAQDLAGNLSIPSAVLDLNLDQNLTLDSFSPDNDETDVLPNANLTLTFDKNVAKGTGNIQIVQRSNDQVQQTIDVTSSNVTINGATVTIDPAENILPPETEFYFTIDEGAFENEAGAPFAGIDEEQQGDHNFTIIAASVVSSVSVPADDLYKVGEDLDFTVTMVLPVTVTGTPTIPITIGDQTVNATLVGTATATSSLTFRYTVVEGDLDTDGIAVGAAMNLNGGTMRDEFDVDAILTLNSVAATDDVLVDGVIPNAPVVVSLSEDSGTASDDQLTNDQTLTFTGTAEANSTVTVFINGSNRGIAIADGSGDWSFDSSVGEAAFTFDEGDHVVTATATDAAGNESAESADFDLTVDITAPAAPTLDLAAATDLGISNTDDRTSGNALTFEGTAEAGSIVNIFLLIDGVPASEGTESTTAGTDGTWQIQVMESLESGDYPLGATATDAAGNTSDLSVMLNLVIDQDLDVTSTSPVDDEIDVLPNANLTITFDKNVAKGSGNIQIIQSSNDQVQQTIDVSGSNVTVNGATVTIDPPANILPPDTEFYINVDGGAFENEAGAPLAALTSKTNWSFTIIAASVVSSVDVPADGTYMIGDNLDFTANMVLPVTITGTATIPLTIGSTTVNATQVGAVSNSSSILFRYTVVEDELDVDGITLGTAMDLNGGTMQDEFGVDAILTLNGVPSTAAVLVDGVKPTPTITSSAVDLVNGTFSATITYDEAVENVTATDLTVVNGSAGNLQNTATGTTWTVDITPAADGEVTVSLAANTANDLAGNDSKASNSISRDFDGTPPQVVSVNRSDGDPLNTGVAEASFQIVFSEAVTGVDMSDLEVVLTGSATATLNTLTPVSGTTYDVNVNGIGGEGTIGLNVKDDDSIIDAATNPLAATFTGQVYTTNFVPTDLSLSVSNIDENNALGTIVTEITTTDADAGDSHTYSLVAGTGADDNASFSIDGSNLIADISFDFESDADYSIRLRTDDGKGGIYEEAFVITVNDVNEVPMMLSLSNNSIDESDLAQEVGTLATLDQDGGESFSYALVEGTGGEDNAEFSISGATLSTAGAINFEAGTTRSILVRVTDSGGLSLDQQFTINIGEVVIEPLRDYETNVPGGAVRNVFSPNGDGVNETWVIEDLLDNPVNEVKVYAQGGKLIFSQVNYRNDWDGTFEGDPIPDGTYYFEINVYEGQTIIRGFLTIIRNR